MSEPTAAIRQLISETAAREGMDPALVLAVVEVESSFNADAIGDAGHSVGLMQLHDQGAGAGLTVAERRDPARNLAVGTAYLRECWLAAEGEVKGALSAYNQGIGGWQQRGWTRVNADYVARAVDAYRRWQVRLMREGVLPPLDAAWGRTRSSWVRGQLLAIKRAVGLG